jgi:hypothetical protein
VAEKRIPDPTLMARLQLSAKGVDWAASLVRHRQHEQPDGRWSAHQHVFHLIAVEREVYQTRLRRMLAEENPVFADWDEQAHMEADHSPEGDVADLAEQFMKERECTFEIFKSLTPAQWARHGTWPGGEVDVAWVAERAVAHALEHFAALLNLHQELEPFHAEAWFAQGS